MSRKELDNLLGGLNTAESTKIKDNQFSVLQNMFYTPDFWLQSRRWIKQFGTQIWGDPITSTFSFINDTTQDSWLIATAWTSLYQYNEWTGVFDEVKTWLTEFEADWVTRARWSFTVYLNIVYLCNGIDDYASYDPATTTYTAIPWEPKVRLLAFLWDAIYWWWADLLPNTLYFTTAWAVNWNDLDANSLVVGWDISGRINCLNELQTQVQVFKDTEVRSVAWDGSSSTPTDTESGWFADRVIKKVWNSLLNLSERGIDTLKARNGVWGTQAIESKPLSDNVRDIFSKVRAWNRKFASAQYILGLTNYYVTIDTTNDSIPESTIVFSSLTKAWSTYTYPALNDYTIFRDEDWEERFLMASANSGVMYEMETGFNDLGASIPVRLRTKKFDFKQPTVFKTAQYVDIVWFKSVWDPIQCNIYMEDEIVWGAEITDDYINENAASLYIGTTTIGTNVIGWGIAWEDEIEVLPFFVRIPMYETGLNIEVELTSDSENLVRIPSKIAMEIENENIELFSYWNIA